MGRETSVYSHAAELTVENYLDSAGNIVLPEGITLMTSLHRHIAQLGDSVSYRYLDYGRGNNAVAVELTWTELGTRIRAISARLQQLIGPVTAWPSWRPQGIDYVIGFFAAISAGNIAVPLFAPELPGHVERLEAVLADATPAVILTTTAVAESVTDRPAQTSASATARGSSPSTRCPIRWAATFVPVAIDTDDIAYLQYTSGSTRVPAGVEITHRAVCTNVLQMIIAGGLDTNIRSVSWLPLYHDMGLVMIMFPALCGGHITLMSPIAFVRRPHRWIAALAAESAHGRTFAAAPNFAFELAAQRGLPPEGETLDLSNVVGLLNGSEPVTMAAIEKFNAAFGPYGLPPTAIKPSYGMAEATLSVASIAPDARPTAVYPGPGPPRRGPGGAGVVGASQCGAGGVVRSGHLQPVGRHRRSRERGRTSRRRVGEIWLHGDNIGRGYWGRDDETDLVFRNKLQTTLEFGSHAEGLPRRASGCGPAISASTSTASCTSPAGSRTWSSSTAATTTRRTSRRRSRRASPAIRSGFVAAFTVAAADLPLGMASSSGSSW